VAAARAIFQQKATRGQETKKEEDELWTKHEAAIISLQPHPKGKHRKGQPLSTLLLVGGGARGVS